MAFQGVIKKNNEMRFKREILMLNIKENFLTVSAKRSDGKGTTDSIKSVLAKAHQAALPH